jgi:hypothetical protein
MCGAGSQQAEHRCAVAGRRNRHAGHSEHVRDVVETHMRLAIFADEARAIHAEHDRQ